MSGQRTPKANHPEEMCFQCRCWHGERLDFGTCLIPNQVGGTIDNGVRYAYEEACFLFWERDGVAR